MTPDHVAIFHGEPSYCEEPPFSPSEAYPEYPFGADRSPTANPAYVGVRSALHLLGLDEEHYGTAGWNPLGPIIRPGDRVVLKPNFVRHFRDSFSGHGNCLITHGSVIRAALDYVAIALQGRGRVTIADAPQNDAEFGAIRRIVGLDAIQQFYRERAGIDVAVHDLRPEEARKVDGVIVGHQPLAGDPAGYVLVDMGADSAFVEVEDLCHLLYGSEYDQSELHRHHRDGRHAYLISKTILEADVVIGLPKLKTHKKVGLTANMKNLVGINGNKNLLPHHREGTPGQGGDQFRDDAARHRLERAVMTRFRRVFPLLGPIRPVIAGPIKAAGKRIFGDTAIDTIRSGNWHGNDTTWRMVLDLTRILMYADAARTLHDTPVRRFLSVVDGIIAGEGNGPLDATPRPAGIVLAGTNPVAVDCACARLMGFDINRLPVIQHAFEPHRYPIVSDEPLTLKCRTNHDPGITDLEALTPLAPPFKPHFGWRGAVELDTASQPADSGSRR